MEHFQNIILSDFTYLQDEHTHKSNHVTKLAGDIHYLLWKYYSQLQHIQEYLLFIQW